MKKSLKRSWGSIGMLSRDAEFAVKNWDWLDREILCVCFLVLFDFHGQLPTTLLLQRVGIATSDARVCAVSKRYFDIYLLCFLLSAWYLACCIPSTVLRGPLVILALLQVPGKDSPLIPILLFSYSPKALHSDIFFLDIVVKTHEYFDLSVVYIYN